jgi:hypothetical protein
MCAADLQSLDCRSSCTPRVGVAVVSAYGVDTAYMLLLYNLSSVSSRRTMSAVGGQCQHWKRQCWQYGAVLQARISVCAHRGCYGSWSAFGVFGDLWEALARQHIEQCSKCHFLAGRASESHMPQSMSGPCVCMHLTTSTGVSSFLHFNTSILCWMLCAVHDALHR